MKEQNAAGGTGVAVGKYTASQKFGHSIVFPDLYYFFYKYTWSYAVKKTEYVVATVA